MELDGPRNGDLRDEMIELWNTIQVKNTRYTDANEIEIDDTYIDIHHARWWETGHLFAKTIQAKFLLYLKRLVPVAPTIKLPSGLDEEFEDEYSLEVGDISGVINASIEDRPNVFNPLFSEIGVRWNEVKVQLTKKKLASTLTEK